MPGVLVFSYSSRFFLEAEGRGEEDTLKAQF